MSRLCSEGRLPLAGIRVLDYSQFVAGPLATMLLGDLGADVVKIESPRGDAYRDYDGLGNKLSRRFLALNRGKRSIVLDLTTPQDRARSRRLIRRADVIVHNMPAKRARRFGLDEQTIHTVNPEVVLATISAFGELGPLADRPGYDLIAQAYSGLLFADPRAGQQVPRRCGHIPLVDITAGLLTAISALTGLIGRRERETAPTAAVSLLGAALLTQVQDLVRLDNDQLDPAATADQLRERGAARERADRLEPYYGCYQTTDGFLALACLNLDQRRRVAATLDINDPWIDHPQRPPADSEEFHRRVLTKQRIATLLRGHTTGHWIEIFEVVGVPCAPVLTLDAAFTDDQVRDNGLLQTFTQPGIGTVELLGSLIHLDGAPLAPTRRHAPALGEHSTELTEPHPPSTWTPP